MAIGLWIIIIFFILPVAGIIGIYLWISCLANPYIFDTVESLPQRGAALLLGTAKFTRKGYPNAFFSHRITKSAAVYKAGKVRQIFVSGAGKTPYNPGEVDDMVQALLQQKARPESIITDYKGYRTRASLWRCKNIYHIVDPLIISQRFHNQRAVFIALQLGMQPIAVNATMVKGTAKYRMILRESLARIKCLLDCYILKPTYP